MNRKQSHDTDTENAMSMSDQYMLGGETKPGDGADLIARLDSFYEDGDSESSSDDPADTQSSDSSEAGGGAPSAPPPEPTEESSSDEIPPLPEEFVMDEAPSTGDPTELPVGAEAPPTPPAADATPEEHAQHQIDLNEYADRVFGDGNGPSRESMLELLQFGTAVATAPPHIQQQINQMLYADPNGQFSTSVPVHADGGSGTQHGTTPTSAPSVPSVPSTPSPGSSFWDDEDLDLDPRVAKYLREQDEARQAELAALQQREFEHSQQQMEQYRQQLVSEQTAALNEWRDAHPDLTETDLTVLCTKIDQTNSFNIAFQMVQDPRKAMTQVLDQALMTDPILSERAIQSRVAAEQARTLADEERKRKASGVSPSPSATGRAAPSSPDDHIAAATAEIRELMNKS